MRKNSRGKLSGAVRNLILQCAKSEASYLGIILSEPETTAHGSSIHSDRKSQNLAVSERENSSRPKKSAAPAVRAAKKSRAAYAALVGMTDVCGLT